MFKILREIQRAIWSHQNKTKPLANRGWWLVNEPGGIPMVPSDFANILYSPMDFSPSGGQRLHLLSITVPAIAFWQSSALVTFLCLQSGLPQLSAGQSPPTWHWVAEICTLPGHGTPSCLRHLHVLLLSASTPYSQKMETSNIIMNVLWSPTMAYTMS